MHSEFCWEGGEGKRPVERRRRRWGDVKYLKEIGWEGVDCIYLAHDSDKWRAVVTTVGKLGFHK